MALWHRNTAGKKPVKTGNIFPVLAGYGPGLPGHSEGTPWNEALRQVRCRAATAAFPGRPGITARRCRVLSGGKPLIGGVSSSGLISAPDWHISRIFYVLFAIFCVFISERSAFLDLIGVYFPFCSRKPAFLGLFGRAIALPAGQQVHAGGGQENPGKTPDTGSCKKPARARVKDGQPDKRNPAPAHPAMRLTRYPKTRNTGGQSSGMCRAGYPGG